MVAVCRYSLAGGKGAALGDESDSGAVEFGKEGAPGKFRTCWTEQNWGLFCRDGTRAAATGEFWTEVQNESVAAGSEVEDAFEDGDSLENVVNGGVGQETNRIGMPIGRTGGS